MRDELRFGKNKRVFLYQGTPNYRNTISLEASGALIERLPNICDKRGEMLVMGKAIATIELYISLLMGLSQSLQQMTYETTFKRSPESIFTSV